MSEAGGSRLAGFLRRLAGGRDREMEDVARSIRKLTEAQRDQTSALQSRLNALADLVAQRSTSKDATEIVHSVRSLAASIDAPQSDTKLYEALDAIAKGSGPIVAGPWTGEVGFEILYWVPFLEWFRTRWRVPAQRFVLISRGGVEPWYGMSGARYVDIFSIMPPQTFRERTDPDAHKQRDVSALDQEIVDSVCQRLGVSGAALLHPRLMYRAFAPFWKDDAGFGLIERFTSHRALAPVSDPVLASLPPEYIAARFYFSDCFRDTAANRAVAKSVIDRISQRTPVVLLNPGLRVDDHADYTASPSGRVMSIEAGLSPERNLAVQSAVISHARGFVGTYGGYAYLAPFYGVPAVGFYSDRAFKLHHLHVAQRVFERLGPATVLAIDTAHAGLVHSVTDAVSS